MLPSVPLPADGANEGADGALRDAEVKLIDALSLLDRAGSTMPAIHVQYALELLQAERVSDEAE